jgi:hypothetical protein
LFDRLRIPSFDAYLDERPCIASGDCAIPHACD